MSAVREEATVETPFQMRPEPGVRAFATREIAQATPDVARQVRGLDMMRRAAGELIVDRPLPELFDLLLELLFSAVRAERGAIVLLEDGELVTKASRSRLGAPVPPISRSLANRVLHDRVALLVDSALRDPRFERAESVILARVHSAIVAPLWTITGESEHVAGLVYLDTSRFAHAFDEDDLRLVTAIANVAAVKIQNHRLWMESLEKERLERELLLAGEMQSSLLPAPAPFLEGWSIAGSSSPCRAMGGDYYDWEFRADGVRLAFGDVAGKGTSAALLVTMLRSLVRTFWGDRDLAAAARRMNQGMHDGAPAGRFATAFVARLGTAVGRLSYVNAGHPAPLVVRADGTVEGLEAGGLPLGLIEGTRYASGAVTLRAGDTMIVFSDGVVEAGGEEEYGTARLLELARQHADDDATVLVRAIMEDLDRFAADSATTDDRAVMVVKRSR